MANPVYTGFYVLYGLAILLFIGGVGYLAWALLH